MCSSAGLQAQSLKKQAGFRKHSIYFGASIYNLTNQNAINYQPTGLLIDSSGSAGGMIGYEFKFNKRFSLALEGYIAGRGVHYQDSSKKNDFLTGSFDASVLLKARYSWIYRPMGKGFFRMYSGLGVGVNTTYVLFDEVANPDIKDGMRFGYQVEAIGVGLSFSWFGLWLEGGYGDQGNVKAGISFNFKK